MMENNYIPSDERCLKNSIDEHQCLLEIRKGKKLSEFEEITKLMELAAVTYHKNGFEEIPENGWFYRLARLSVIKDFRALHIIPEPYRAHCFREFSDWSSRLKRAHFRDYQELFNGQDSLFLANAVKYMPTMSKYVDGNNDRERSLRQSARKRTRNAFEEKPQDRGFELKEEQFSFDFSSMEEALDADMGGEYGDRKEMTIEAFLSLPVKEKTKEALDALLKSDKLFPEDFIKKLTIPNRNAAYYGKKGEKEKEAYWKEQIIPFLTREVCEEIALKHPEASIETTPYLSREGIEGFWRKSRTERSKDELTKLFLSFPEEMLNLEMAKDIRMSWLTLQHAPSVFVGTKEADKVINRYPGSVLRLPECYQSPGRILNDAVPLTKKTISYVKNEALRTKIALALNIQVPKECA